MCVFVTHLVHLWVYFHGARSELDGLIFEDVTKAKPSDLKGGLKMNLWFNMIFKGTVHGKCFAHQIIYRLSQTTTAANPLLHFLSASHFCHSLAKYTPFMGFDRFLATRGQHKQTVNTTVNYLSWKLLQIWSNIILHMESWFCLILSLFSSDFGLHPFLRELWAQIMNHSLKIIKINRGSNSRYISWVEKAGLS